MSDFATVILKNGGSYQTPVENLDNVRRILSGKFQNIILPGEEEEPEEEDEIEIDITKPITRKGKGKKK
jgi:hypothetical protein